MIVKEGASKEMIINDKSSNYPVKKNIKADLDANI